MRKYLLLIVAVTLIALQSVGQETTSTLSGRVFDEKNNPIQGASIVVKHEPTGSTTGTQSNSKGIFVVPNLKPGGPYTITVSFTGFSEEKFDNISLNLGDNTALSVPMKVNSTSLKELVVTTTKRTNSGLTVGKNQLATLPSIGRSVSDFTRLTPQSNNNSFGGSNFRYNNLTLDGAINNDAIGFSNSFGGVSGGGQQGAAGAGTRTNPYSLETIQEVQVQLAPYDVKLGNFTGGSVNAVTKSGTNDFHGSIYGYGRNQTFVGKSVDGQKKSIGSDFYDYQTGFTLGGPIIKNKLFFFVNGELTRRQEPTFYNAGDPGAAISLADAQAISNQFKTKYGYDVGSYDQYKIFTNSNKLFARLDWNLSSKSTLMLRAIYTSGWGNNLERTSTNFQFTSTDFTQHTNNLNLVGELKTKFSNTVNNSFVASYINVHEYRDFPGVLAPFVDIDNGRIWAGTWREASIYNMKQKTIEISDNLTWTKGIHKFTFGTHNEFYDLSYGFINSWNGRWEYSRGVNSFLADNPSRIRGAFTLDENKMPNDRDHIYNNPPNPFNVNLLSAYGQDEISFSRKFKLSAGLRVDYSFVGEQPTLDPEVNTIKEYHSPDPTYSHTPFSELNNKWLGKATLSPRIGFNFDVNGDQSVVLRGGTGIFVGRMPFAWLGYAYTLTGGVYGNIDWNNIPATQTVPLAIDPQGLKDTVLKYGGASKANTREVDVIDNNFKMPRVWRSNIAADFKFGHGYKLTLDAMYTKTLYDVKFQQINIKDSVAYFSSGPTETPVYVGGKLNANYSNLYFLTNTTEGWRYNLTVQLSKVTNNIRVGATKSLNLNWSAAYTYGMSKDLSNGIRNSFESNFNLNPAIIPNTPTLSYSNFDLRHRIVGTLGLGMNWNEKNRTSLNFFFSAQSGNPYSVIYQSAPFGNGSNAPLPYIPKDQSDINLADVKNSAGDVTYSATQQWNDLSAFINGNDYLKNRKGKYAERNGLRTPWNNELDLRIMHEFRLSKTNNQHILTVSFDIFNFLNMLNNDWGHITFVTNVNNYTVNFLKFVKDANGKNPGAPGTGYIPTFNYVSPGSTGHYYTVDPINSRWQGQLGVKYSF